MKKSFPLTKAAERIKKSRKTVVTVPMPKKQKYDYISVSCGSWDDYTSLAAPQLSYEYLIEKKLFL